MPLDTRISRRAMKTERIGTPKQQPSSTVRLLDSRRTRLPKTKFISKTRSPKSRNPHGLRLYQKDLHNRRVTSDVRVAFRLRRHLIEARNHTPRTRVARILRPTSIIRQSFIQTLATRPPTLPSRRSRSSSSASPRLMETVRAYARPQNRWSARLPPSKAARADRTYVDGRSAR